MWSSNLLLAYSLQKFNKEKRERQPNWTEPEKQLLLSLTRMHQPILENKGSDTMTIKRKSQAWDEITLRMKAAGYNRTKDRLKQQLGRIRATESKRIKETLERNSTTDLSKCSNDSTNDSIIESISIKPQVQEMQSEIQHPFNKMNALLPVPLVLQEHHYIKSEDSHTIDEIVCSEQELEINSSTFTKPNIIACTTMNNFKNSNDVDDIKILDNIHFKLQNIQSLAEINHNSEVTKSTACTSEAKPTCAADVTSTISCANLLTSNIKTSTINDNEEDAVANNFQMPKQQQNKRRVRYIRTNRQRTSFRRAQGLRQLYMYRVAIERERLRSLKQQQKRERILYRKDVEIQNLKLQILRNLSNQNRDGNSINF